MPMALSFRVDSGEGGVLGGCSFTFQVECVKDVYLTLRVLLNFVFKKKKFLCVHSSNPEETLGEL